MSCSHLSSIRQPASEKPVIHKEECTQCFQGDTSPDGVDVCLHCFNGGCTGAASMHHSERHAALCHPLVLNIRKIAIAKPPPADEPMAEAASAPVLTPAEQLAAAKKKLEDEAAEPTHYYEREVRCLACKVVVDPASYEPLGRCVQAIVDATSIAQSAGIAYVDDDVKTDCSHCVNIVQVANPPSLEARTLATCADCDVAAKMWLCLTCGHLGCSRRQMMADKTFTPGNGHAVAHAEATGHHVVLKVGTLTAEGRGDAYCYKCDSSVEDDQLARQVQAFGITTIDAVATEETTKDLNLAMNLKMNWSLVFEEDGKEAALAFGPGKTGLANLGNSSDEERTR